MTWTPPELPEHVEVRKPRDDANKPHAHKVNKRDVVEIELMNKHWDEDLTETQWLALCTKYAGAIYQNQKTREKLQNESQ